MSAPFFKFSAVEWIAGAVQAVGYAERGIFVELCARTWMQGEPLKRGDKLARLLRLSLEELDAALVELASLDIVELAEDGSIRIKFLEALAAEDEEASKVAREKANVRWSKCKSNAPAMQEQCTGNAPAMHRQCGEDASAMPTDATAYDGIKTAEGQAVASAPPASTSSDKETKENLPPNPPLKEKRETPSIGARTRAKKEGGTILVAVNPLGESSFVKSYMKAADFSKWGETEFRASVAEAVKAHPEYATDVEDFARYWLEPDKTGKPRFALQKTWATGGRLATWHQRSLNDRNGKGRQPLNAAGEGEWRI